MGLSWFSGQVISNSALTWNLSFLKSTIFHGFAQICLFENRVRLKSKKKNLVCLAKQG